MNAAFEVGTFFECECERCLTCCSAQLVAKILLGGFGMSSHNFVFNLTGNTQQNDPQVSALGKNMN